MPESAEENFDHEAPSLSLSGSSYFFTGQQSSYGRLPSIIGDPLEIKLNHKTGYKTTEYIVLGTNNEYFRCTRPKVGNVAAINNSDLEHYEDLVDFLRDHDVERPTFLSLGAEGYYYIRAEDGAEKWVLPAGAEQRIFGQAHGAFPAAVESLWLGCSSSYVAQRQDGSRVVNLDGKYAGLGLALGRQSEEVVKITALAMNLRDGETYALLWNNGEVDYETGSMDVFDGGVFDLWVSENYGDKQSSEHRQWVRAKKHI